MITFQDLCKNREKVIVYNFKVNAIIWDEDHKRVTFRKEELTFSKGTALDLRWYVGFRATSKLEEYPQYLYLNGNNADRDYSNTKVSYMPWTPEREAFFKRLQESLDDMILRAYNFFQQTEDIPKLIDAGMRLLPAPQEEST